jgi:hypothetical protein
MYFKKIFVCMHSSGNVVSRYTLNTLVASPFSFRILP